MADFSAVAPPKTLSGSYDTNAAFADAVQRARQIAAKIHSGDSGTKRLRDDIPDGMPEAKKLATSQDSIAHQIASMQAQRVAGAATSISVDEWKVPDKMVGLIIGRGGEQIMRLQAESGCKVQMAADSGGLPDRACTLTGTRQSIEKAKELISQIISRGGPPLPVMDTVHVADDGAVVEIYIPGPKVGLVIGKGGETIRNLQERAGVKMVLIQEGPQQTTQEKPLRITGDSDKCEYAKQLVMDLITEKELESIQRGGYEGANEYGSTQGGPVGAVGGSGTHEIMVPKQAVGVIIGKGGEMIKRIQQDSGAKVQFLNVKEDSPEDKICIVTGVNEQIQAAASFINDLIQSVLVRDQQNVGRGRGRGRGETNGGPGHSPGGRGRPDIPEVHYSVPGNKCGLVIGKGGETVKNINQQSGAYVTLSALAAPNPNEKVFIIKGQMQQIEHAKELINEKIGGIGTVIQTNNAPNPNFQQNFHQPQQQPQQFPQQGGPQQQFVAQQEWGNAYQPWQAQGAPANDPNAAWAAYYNYYGQQAAQQPAPPGSQPTGQQPGMPPQPGMPAQPEQNQIQAQQTAVGGTPAVTNAATPGIASQPDYSAAWAEYYRSMCMFREAEMIENQARAQAQMVASGIVPQPAQPFPQAQLAPGTTAPVTAAAIPPSQPVPPGSVPPTPVPAVANAVQPSPVPPTGPSAVPTGVPAPGQPFPAPAQQGQWPPPGTFPMQQFQQQQAQQPQQPQQPPNAYLGYNFQQYAQPPFATSAAAPQ